MLLQSLNRSSVPYKHLIDSRMLRSSSSVEKYEDEGDSDPSLAWLKDGKVYDKGRYQLASSMLGSFCCNANVNSYL